MEGDDPDEFSFVDPRLVIDSAEPDGDEADDPYGADDLDSGYRIRMRSREHMVPVLDVEMPLSLDSRTSRDTLSTPSRGIDGRGRMGAASPGQASLGLAHASPKSERRTSSANRRTMSIESSKFPRFSWNNSEDRDVVRTASTLSAGAQSLSDVIAQGDSYSQTTTSEGTDPEDMPEPWQLGCVERMVSAVLFYRWRFQAWLVENPSVAIAITGISAAFAYLYTMILRFPMITGKIDAQDHDDTTEWPRLFNLTWKPLMIVAFGVGYTVGKVPATFLFSAVPGWRRLRIMALIAVSTFLLMVAFYPLLPLVYVALGLLIGGIPMSFMYGLVGQYLEGRDRTEVLVSSLGAAMMLGAPLARFLAQLLSERGVSTDYAPTWLGLAFLPVTLIAMLVLDTVPPPTATDAVKRSERRPANLSVAWRFVSGHKLGCFMITITYMAICAFRNYRDYFASDIYSTAMKGEDLQSWHFLMLECPSTIVVFFAISWLSREKDNVRALMWISVLVAVGAVLCMVATALYQNEILLKGGTGGIVWVMLIIAGTYLMYIPFGFVLQDRLVAVFNLGTTAVVLINAIDIFGQLASLGVVLYRELMVGQIESQREHRKQATQARDYHEFYITLIYPFCGFIAVVNLCACAYFLRRAVTRRGNPRLTVRDAGSFNIQDDETLNDSGPLIASHDGRRQSAFLRLAQVVEDDGVVDSGSDVEGSPTQRRRRTSVWSRSRSGSQSQSHPSSPNDGPLYTQCTECPSRFTQPEVFRLHMRNVHMAVPAWCDEPLQLRSRIMALAADKRNFNRRLSARTKRFNMHMFQRCAQATMTAQPELARLYDQLVPSEVTEHGFWANYANRVKLIVSGFYASAGGRKFRQEFESDAEYGEYLSKSGLLRPGVKVLCREKMADLKVGDLGEYVSTEPINPPLSIFFRRVNGQRFLDWHQVEVIVDLWAVEGGDPIPTPLSSDESAFSATGGVYE